MTFTTTALVGHQYLVEGEDSLGQSGSAILDGSQFDEILAHSEHEAAHEDFDRAVERFFSPLTSAAEKLSARHEEDEDPLSYYVVTPGREAVEGKAEERLRLTHDTMVLRALLIESPVAAQRVRWVGTDRLVITKAAPATEENTAQSLPSFIQDILDNAVAAGAEVHVFDGSNAEEGGVDIDLPAETDEASEPTEAPTATDEASEPTEAPTATDETPAEGSDTSER